MFDDLVITDFSGENFFLSTFFPNIIVMDIAINGNNQPVQFKNAEAAYQFGKAYFANNKDMMKKIKETETAKDAKKLGDSIKFKDPTLWDNYKIKWMYQVLFLKFLQNCNLQIKLLGTYPKVLIFINPYNERYWGIDERTKIGSNYLGILLNLIRNRFLDGHSLTNLINFNVNI